MIEAKRDLILARLAILRNDLVEAEIRVESAAKKIDEARSLALGHLCPLASIEHGRRRFQVFAFRVPTSNSADRWQENFRPESRQSFLRRVFPRWSHCP